MSSSEETVVFRVTYHRSAWDRRATRKLFLSSRAAHVFAEKLKTTVGREGRPPVSPLDILNVDRAVGTWGGCENLLQTANTPKIPSAPARAPRRPVGSTPENAVTDDMFLPDWEEIG